MSGGSYDYLHDTAPSGFVEDPDHAQLQAMRDRLTELGYKDAAQATEAVRLVAAQCDVRLGAMIRQLQGVWKAVEWQASSDWGMDRVEEAIAEYRGEGRKVYTLAPRADDTFAVKYGDELVAILTGHQIAAVHGGKG